MQFLCRPLRVGHEGFDTRACISEAATEPLKITDDRGDLVGRNGRQDPLTFDHQLLEPAGQLRDGVADARNAIHEMRDTVGVRGQRARERFDVLNGLADRRPVFLEQAVDCRHGRIGFFEHITRATDNVIEQ